MFKDEMAKNKVYYPRNSSLFESGQVSKQTSSNKIDSKGTNSPEK